MIGRMHGLSLSFVACLFLACDHGTSPPPAQEPFFLRIVVRDPAGNPVPGIRVSVYPPFEPGSLPKAAAGQSPLGVNASSTVNFALATNARVELSLNDLDGSLIQQLMGNSLRNPGLYAVTFSLRRNDGIRVMVCRLVAADTATGRVAFRDSIYVTLWQPDASVAVAGYTSGSGTFESRDTLAFPYILTLPPMVVTRNDPTVLGTFSIPDSCMITLTDTARAAHMTFGRRLVRGPNEITVTWNPTVSPVPAPWGEISVLPPVLPSTTGAAFEWKLYQNYPNPFN